MLNLSHKKLDVWKLSLNFVSLIYEITHTLPSAEKYGLQSQIRRAAISIPSNIAEGAARKSKAEKNRYYEIARSSLVEIDTQFEITRMLNYISQDRLNILSEDMNHIFAKLSNIIKKNQSLQT